MANNTVCTRCNNGCESKNSCTTCNSCQLCNNTTCEVTCILVQAFCSPEGSGQSAGGFNFNQCVSSDQTFLTKANWNRLISYINNAYAKGSKQSGGDSGLPSSDNNEFMTAEMFNKVSNALGGLGSSGPGYNMEGGPSGDIILGSYFVNLESYADALNYKTNQCDKCNDSCDVTCKECQKCNIENCGACDSGCQDHSPSYSYPCESCVNCQSACEKSAQTTTT